MRSTLLVAALVVGCSSSTSTPADVDAGPIDDIDAASGSPDGALHPDAAVHPDAPVTMPDAHLTAVDAAVHPDTAPGAPDAHVSPPDAAVHPDAPLGTPDAAVAMPDAHVNPPDAAVAMPDAHVNPPDAPVPTPDAAAPPATVTAGACIDGKSWSAPVRLDDGSPAGGPAIAVDGAGNVLAVWTQMDAAGKAVHYAYYTPGGGWGPSTAIVSAPTITQSPHVALDSAGYGMISWTQGPMSDVVGFTSFTPGTGPQYDAMFTRGQILGTAVTIDDTGNAIATWAERTMLGVVTSWVMSSTFPGGFGWFGDPFQMLDGGGGAPLVSGGGHGWAYFSKGSGSGGEVDGARADGGWRALGIAGEGNAIISVTDVSVRGTTGTVMYPVTPRLQVLVTDLASTMVSMVTIRDTGRTYSEPHGQVDSDGGLVLGFFEFLASGTNVLGERLVNGVSPTQPALLSSGALTRLALRARGDASGNTFIAWTEENAAAVFAPFIACYSAQHGWRAGVAIPDSGNIDPYSIDLAVAGDGNAALIWTAGDQIMVSVLH